MPRDRWPDLCKKYAPDDGLAARDVGAWTEDKLYFWNRYIDITTRAMVGHPRWKAGLAYIDLFAGPGICRVEQSGKRIPGSSLIAANAPKLFGRILASELDEVNADALRVRLASSPSASAATVFCGDCNKLIREMVEHIPERALTLAFIDPENLGVEFDTVSILAACGRVDLLVLFADRMDIVRNVELYERQTASILDRMLGPGSQWRARWRSLANRSAGNICQLFADEYRAQLRRLLGYRTFGERVIPERRPLYRLIFASKSDKGLDFWQKVTKKDRGGQTDFDFGG